MPSAKELEQIPLDRHVFRFSIFDSKEYSISGHMLEELLELTASGASDNRRLQAQLHKLGLERENGNGD
tara:strand:- start:1134 stop:1340 length:207 start_codon:yes stop_codon:yes gene_type:complete